MEIIALLGKKRASKDTIADYLVQNYGFEKYSFADPIKKGAMAMFGFSYEQMYGTDSDKETVDPRWGISPRRMLQLLGTELYQYDIQKHLKTGEFPFGRKVWVNSFKVWFEEKIKENPNIKVVIADMRFVHEANVIEELGGKIWKVERPSLSNNDEHSSETESDLIIPDTTIVNDGTLYQLYNKIQKLIS